jgi:hypothetical protein
MKEDTQTIVAAIRELVSTQFELIANGEPYQVREVYDLPKWTEHTKWLQQHDWTFLPGELVFAEDSNGNFFTIGSDGHISFLDHETDERTPLCDSLEEFKSRLQEPEDVELPPLKVISGWVDPDFKPEFH